MNFGLIAAMISAIAWGFVYSRTENILDKMSPISAMASFYVFGSLFFLPLFFRNKKEILNVISTNTIDYFVIMLFVLIAETAVIYSIKYLGGTEASFLEVSYPIWAIMFTYMATKSFPNYKVMVGGLLILLGSFIISKYSEGR